MQNNTIEIFGKSFPLYKNPNGTYDENCVAFKDWLPWFFINQEHFSSQEYYSELIKYFPQFKRKWYDFRALPSEQDIENYIISNLGYAALDGANSVPLVEKKYGIKIGGDYKYPNGMTDIEYHAYSFNIRGFSHVWYKEINTEQDAYMYIWQCMHYSKDEEISVLQSLVQELIELNPQLKTIRFNKDSRRDLMRLQAGVMYNFPMADIQMFLDGIEKDYPKKMCEKMRSVGLNPRDFEWVLSFDTIQDIAQKIGKTDVNSFSGIEYTKHVAQQDNNIKPNSFKRATNALLKKIFPEFKQYKRIQKDDR
ncbi:MAG: hypothetical protein J6T57_01455 [Alphaproteobacteria bacterium]|nr:hypothetical protein [Alphaproteobacteria bacterium]